MLTANHVICDARDDKVEFFLRQPGSLADVGSVPAKISPPTGWTVRKRLPQPAYDIAALEVDTRMCNPSVEFYDLEGINAQMPNLNEGTSLVYCGIPVSAAIGGSVLSICDEHMLYNPHFQTQNSQLIRKTDHDPDTQILVPYSRIEEGIKPQGFSGSGVWARQDRSVSQIWQSQHILIGVIVGYIRRIRAMNVTCIPTIVNLIDP